MQQGGFSLVECLIAAVVLSTGLLGLVASERAMQRLDLLADRTTTAAELAQGRLDAFRATACLAPASGSSAGPVSALWSTSGRPAPSVTVSVTFLSDARARTIRYDLSLHCGRAP